MRPGLLLPLPLLGDLVPDARVDPQGARQGQVQPGAGDPAAQGAAHAADDAVRLRHLLQAAGAEGVLAVEHPRDPVAAGVLAVAHRALQLLTGEHGEGFRRLFEFVASFKNKQKKQSHKYCKKRGKT